MKRAVLLLLFALTVLAVPAFAQSDIFLLGFGGFDYESPNSVPGTYLAVGEGYKALGFVTSFGAYLAPYVNTTANEYTYSYHDLTVVSSEYIPDFDSWEYSFANPGRGRYYEDAKTGGTPALYGVYPPNATAPWTFIDGTVILGGRIENLMLSYDFVAAQGGFSGNISFDEGTLLGSIPVTQRDGWILAGHAGRPNPSIPSGYDHQVSGECRIPGPVPAAHKTWGALKALYR
jgi:hypothetical protein